MLFIELPALHQRHPARDRRYEGPGEGGQRYLISDGMRDGFIPHRKQILIDYLNTGKAPVRPQ